MKKKEKTGTRRRWLLTIFPEYFEGSVDYIPFLGVSVNEELFTNTFFAFKDSIRYVAYSLEDGEQSEHDHFHAYIELKKPQRFSFFQRLFGKKHHFEACAGGQDDNIDYISHSGLHKDKPGHLLSPVFEWGIKFVSEKDERGAYDIAINMLFDGESIQTICRTLGGSILTQVGNLCRLKAEIEGEATRKKEIESNYALVAQMKSDIEYLSAELDARYRERVCLKDLSGDKIN